MSRPKCPCDRHCPGRHGGCQTECEKYKFYESQMRDYYADELKRKNADAVLINRRVASKRKWLRRAK